VAVIQVQPEAFLAPLVPVGHGGGDQVVLDEAVLVGLHNQRAVGVGGEASHRGLGARGNAAGGDAIGAQGGAAGVAFRGGSFAADCAPRARRSFPPDGRHPLGGLQPRRLLALGPHPGPAESPLQGP